jgi:hypothetical protein
MQKRIQLAIVGLLALGLVLSSACTKDVPPGLKAVPADTDLVASVDAQALLAFAKGVVGKAVPTDMQSQIPTYEMLSQQAMSLAGLDLSKLTRLTVLGSITNPNDMAIIAEGLTAANVKGQQKGEHQGQPLFQVPGIGVTYAELKGLGLVAAGSEAMLKKVVDTYLGKAPGIHDTERGKVLARLLETHQDYDQLRVYLLANSLPDMPIPVKMQGAGFFLHLDRGVAGVLLSDKQGAGDIASKINLGLMTVQAAVGLGGGKEMGVELDKDTLKTISDALGKLRTELKDDSVALIYPGDLKPLLERAVALGVQEARKDMALPAGDDALPAGEEAPPAPGGKPSAPTATP